MRGRQAAQIEKRKRKKAAISFMEYKSSDELSQDQRRRCNDLWAICIGYNGECGQIVEKDKKCLNCGTHFQDLKDHWKPIFDKEKQEEKNEIDARAKAVAGSSGSPTSPSVATRTKGGDEIHNVIMQTFQLHVMPAYAQETAYFETINSNWKGDLDGDLKGLFHTIYVTKKNAGEKMTMLNQIRNTQGAIDTNGRKWTPQEIMKNLISILDDALKAGILTSA